tara:strand:+ start:108 stop:332 length:225 start_codon:yes stop_codon:yes gene_type:complete
MKNNFQDELQMFNNSKTFELHKKVEKEVKEREKPIDPRDMFGKKIRGAKNKSQYKKSMADAKTSKCKKNLMCSC